MTDIKAELAKLPWDEQIENATTLLIESEADFGKITAKYACELINNLTPHPIRGDVMAIIKKNLDNLDL